MASAREYFSGCGNEIVGGNSSQNTHQEYLKVTDQINLETPKLMYGIYRTQVHFKVVNYSKIYPISYFHLGNSSTNEFPLRNIINLLFYLELLLPFPSRLGISKQDCIYIYIYISNTCEYTRYSCVCVYIFSDFLFICFK